MSKQLSEAQENLSRLRSSLTLRDADTSKIEKALDRLEEAESLLFRVAKKLGYSQVEVNKFVLQGEG